MNFSPKYFTGPFAMRLFFLLYFLSFACIADAQKNEPSALQGCEVKAVSSGNTTGNIGTLQITNTSNKTIVATIPPVLIPETGKYQGYIVPNPSSVLVLPNKMVTIPITGFCTDITRPPVPKGVDYIPFNQWVFIDPADSLHITTPHRRTDIAADPNGSAPILYHAINAITYTYDSLHGKGVISTPFSSNPEKEREAVIQQTFWIYTSGLSGKQYSKEEFKSVTAKQFEQQTGQSLSRADTNTKKEIGKGVDAFWASFTLVGQSAKVLSSSEATVPISNPEKETGCKATVEKKSNPEFDLQIEVADSWGDEKERKKIKDDMKSELSKEESATFKDSKGNVYNLSQPPASAYAFWKDNHIGGYASAFAKTKFIRKNWNSDWVWSTQQMDTKASGNKRITLTMGGNGCESFVVGTSLARVKATSEASDPLAGHEDFLNAVNYLGKLAIEIAITHGKGEFKGLGDFLKDKIKDEVKGMAEDALMDKISQIVGFDISQYKVEEPEIEPLDFASQASNTYAKAYGKMDITVGKNKGTAEANSGAFYKREKLEKSKDVLSGGVTMCKETVVSDGQPGSLTATVTGNVAMSAKAEGNGYAKANLESMWAVSMVGICKCDNKWIWDAVSDAGYYVKDGETMDNNDLNEIDKIVDGIGKKLEDGSLPQEQAAVQKALDEAMLKWWNDKRTVWKECK